MHNSRFPKQGFDSGSKELTRDGKSEKQTEAKLNMRRRARLISDSSFFLHKGNIYRKSAPSREKNPKKNIK